MYKSIFCWYSLPAHSHATNDSAITSVEQDETYIYGVAAGGASVVLAAGPVMLDPARLAAAGETGAGCVLASCCSGRKLAGIASNTMLIPNTIVTLLSSPNQHVQNWQSPEGQN